MTTHLFIIVQSEVWSLALVSIGFGPLILRKCWKQRRGHQPGRRDPLCVDGRVGASPRLLKSLLPRKGRDDLIKAIWEPTDYLDVNFALRPQELVYAPPRGIQHISGLSSRCHPRAPPCPKASGQKAPAAVSPFCSYRLFTCDVIRAVATQ